MNGNYPGPERWVLPRPQRWKRWSPKLPRRIREYIRLANQIFEYILNRVLPSGKLESMKFKSRSSRYCIIEIFLYKCSLNEQYMICSHGTDAYTAMKQTHDGFCRSHSWGRSVAIQVKKYKYFWPTFTTDCKQFALRSDKCQRHAPMLHQPAEKLSSISSPYPLMRWFMDIVGPLAPSGSEKLWFLLVRPWLFHQMGWGLDLWDDHQIIIPLNPPSFL